MTAPLFLQARAGDGGAAFVGPLPGHARAAVLREAVAPKGRPTATDRDPSLVAVQSVEDPLYFALFSAIADALSRRRSIRGELVVVRAVSGAIGVGARAWIMRSAWIYPVAEPGTGAGPTATPSPRWPTAPCPGRTL